MRENISNKIKSNNNVLPSLSQLPIFSSSYDIGSLDRNFNLAPINSNPVINQGNSNNESYTNNTNNPNYTNNPDYTNNSDYTNTNTNPNTNNSNYKDQGENK
jgi:hypothetical protein